MREKAKTCENVEKKSCVHTCGFQIFQNNQKSVSILSMIVILFSVCIQTSMNSPFILDFIIDLLYLIIHIIKIISIMNENIHAVLCLVAQSCLTLQSHGLQPTRLLCP